MSCIALVDCNNFFVSCETVFNPKLRGRPVVVLSNNDGCIIARSQEAKALGIPMGAPIFKWRDFLERQRVTVLSSNFALYGDLSHRVMEILSYFNPNLEIYSVDEAFLALDGIADPEAHCRHIREKILQWTGIPVSIGIAPSKTLAKVANYKAKRDPALQGVYAPTNFMPILKEFPIEEVWGIGGRLSLSLQRRGIYTVADLIAKDDLWIRKHLSVVGLRTVWELRGLSCLSLDEAPCPSSRS